MATNTSIVGLTKPTYEEFGDVGVINGNMDLIDSAIGQRSRVPNLVINGNFMPGYIVNQRGDSSYSGSVYGIDMWRGTSSKSVVSISENGLSLTHSGTTSYAGCMQKFPSHIYDTYYNSTLTIAACSSDGTIVARSGIPANGTIYATFSSNLYAQIYAPSDEGYMAVRFMNGVGGSTGTFRWVAVYPGAFNVNTLPTYIPKGHAVELLDCQQYFRRFTDKVEACGALDASTLIFGIDSLGMAGIPSIKVNSITNAKLPCAYLSSSQLSGASVVGMGNATIKSSATLTPREAGYIHMSYDLSYEP